MGSAVLAGAVPAGSAPVAQGTEIFPGWFIVDGVVTGPSTSPRTLNSKQAAAFIQSFLPATFYGKLRAQNPPASLPVFTVTAREVINGQPYKIVTYYVSRGANAWVGLPPQDFGPGASIPKQKWFISGPRTTPAFLGRLDPIPSVANTTTTTVPATKPHKSSGGAAGWIVAVGVILVGVVLSARYGRQRNRRVARSTR